tara:strand:- start:1217 stop:1969 length:753 start_codon:yes stop_codon:yes gene_type:complete
MIGLLLDPFEQAWLLLKAQSREQQLRDDVARHEASVRRISEHLDKNHPNYISIDAIRQSFGSTPQALETSKRAYEKSKAELEEYMGGRGAKEAERKKERTRQQGIKNVEFSDAARERSESRQQSAQAKDDARVQAEKDAEDAKRRAEEKKHEANRIKVKRRTEYQERKLGKPQEETAIDDPDAPIESVLDDVNRRERAKLGDADEPVKPQPERRFVGVKPKPQPKEEEEDWEKDLREQSSTFSYDPYGDN